MGGATKDNASTTLGMQHSAAVLAAVLAGTGERTRLIPSVDHAVPATSENADPSEDKNAAARCPLQPSAGGVPTIAQDKAPSTAPHSTSVPINAAVASEARVETPPNPNAIPCMVAEAVSNILLEDSLASRPCYDETPPEAESLETSKPPDPERCRVSCDSNPMHGGDVGLPAYAMPNRSQSARGNKASLQLSAACIPPVVNEVLSNPPQVTTPPVQPDCAAPEPTNDDAGKGPVLRGRRWSDAERQVLDRWIDGLAQTGDRIVWSRIVDNPPTELAGRTKGSIEARCARQFRPRRNNAKDSRSSAARDGSGCPPRLEVGTGQACSRPPPAISRPLHPRRKAQAFGRRHKALTSRGPTEQQTGKTGAGRSRNGPSQSLPMAKATHFVGKENRSGTDQPVPADTEHADIFRTVKLSGVCIQPSSLQTNMLSLGAENAQLRLALLAKHTPVAVASSSAPFVDGDRALNTVPAATSALCSGIAELSRATGWNESTLRLLPSELVGRRLHRIAIPTSHHLAVSSVLDQLRVVLSKEALVPGSVAVRTYVTTLMKNGALSVLSSNAVSSLPEARAEIGQDIVDAIASAVVHFINLADEEADREDVSIEDWCGWRAGLLADCVLQPVMEWYREAKDAARVMPSLSSAIEPGLKWCASASSSSDIGRQGTAVELCLALVNTAPELCNACISSDVGMVYRRASLFRPLMGSIQSLAPELSVHRDNYM